MVSNFNQTQICQRQKALFNIFFVFIDNTRSQFVSNVIKNKFCKEFRSRLKTNRNIFFTIANHSLYKQILQSFNFKRHSIENFDINHPLQTFNFPNIWPLIAHLHKNALTINLNFTNMLLLFSSISLKLNFSELFETVMIQDRNNCFDQSFRDKGIEQLLLLARRNFPDCDTSLFKKMFVLNNTNNLN